MRETKTKVGLSMESVKKEAEEAFFDKNKQQYRDRFHSNKEERWILLGKTNQGRLLFIAFTIRNRKVRVISARTLNRKERIFYEKTT